MIWKFMCIIEREDDWYISYCEELGIVSEGRSIDEAKKNLEEAMTMFFEDASFNEILDILRNIEPSSLVEVQYNPEVQAVQHQQDPVPQWKFQVA